MDHHPQSASVLLGFGRLYKRKYIKGVFKAPGPYNHIQDYMLFGRFTENRNYLIVEHACKRFLGYIVLLMKRRTRKRKLKLFLCKDQVVGKMNLFHDRFTYYHVSAVEHINLLSH